jgi:hypothetical protein
VKPYATPIAHLVAAGESGLPEGLHAAFAGNAGRHLAPPAGGVLTLFSRLAAQPHRAPPEAVWDRIAGTGRRGRVG